MDTKESSERNTIKVMEISPGATLIVAVIGSQVVVRVTNLVGKSQFTGSNQYNKSIMFLPIHFDEDFHFNFQTKLISQNKEKLSDET